MLKSHAAPNEAPRSCTKDVGSGRPYLLRVRVRLRRRPGPRLGPRVGEGGGQREAVPG